MNTQTQQVSASFRMAVEDDSHLPTYDNTKLVAINTCPTWGILRYAMHKQMPSAGRALALECGSAMHECFAFIRLVSLRQQFINLGRIEYGNTLWINHGVRLFGEQRFEQIVSDTIPCGGDHIEIARCGSIATLNTGEYYDDPRDRRRTLSNMEECILAYINRWRWDQPVWVRDDKDTTTDVGIEIPFDVVCDLSTPTRVYSVRLTGKIDGLHVHAQNTLTLHENKTASRLGDAWSMSFALASQVTQYCIAASVFTGQDVRRADVLGLCIPLPKTYEYGGFVREPVVRHDYHFARWLSWLDHTIGIAEQFDNDPYNAPKYTHSCNRYFRPCSMIPFCDAEDADQHEIVQQMEINEWSPLHKEVLD